MVTDCREGHHAVRHTLEKQLIGPNEIARQVEVENGSPATRKRALAAGPARGKEEYLMALIACANKDRLSISNPPRMIKSTPEGSRSRQRRSSTGITPWPLS
jgi:hypothetical protein